MPANAKRQYREFVYREAVFHIACVAYDAVTQAIVRERHVLEDYIRRHPAFRTALTPVRVARSAPVVVRRMATAGARVGVGPMAAVAGVMAQLAAEAGLAAGADDAIVENGGDIFLVAARPVVVSLFTGAATVADRLAFRIEPADTPLSVCSSSGRMGHSFSMGACDLATVVAHDGGLADAAATYAANLVRSEQDVPAALERVVRIAGVAGVLIVQGDRVGLRGRLPELIRHQGAA